MKPTDTVSVDPTDPMSGGRSAERRAGWLVPAFSLRRDRDLGIGDTAALIEWIHLAAASGVRLLQLLPINETGAGNSPYTTISSMALEPLYLTAEPGWLPGVAEADLAEAHDLLDERIHDEFIDYPAVRVAKGAILRKAFERWRDDDTRDDEGFTRFCRAEAGWLTDYTRFRWLMEEAGGSEAWDAWPEEFATPAAARRHIAIALAQRNGAITEHLEYFAWLQWMAAIQWQRVRDAADAAGVHLMGDVPIGISYHSADAFFEPQFFDLDWCGGAPPEEMFKHDEFISRWGQNWGVPLYRWDALEADDFSWWRRRIRGLTRVFHHFRIDHVLGFYRIYSFPWQPARNPEFLHLTDQQALDITGGKLPRWAPRPDDSPANQQANRDDGDRRLRALLQAAGHAEVIGEDLGCVPPYVRPHLASLGIAGFHIPHWEDHDDGRVIAPEEIPYLSLTTYATHDHEPLAVLWADGHQRWHEQHQAGVEDESATDQLRRLMDFAGLKIPKPRENWPKYTRELRRALIAALLRSAARDAVLMLPDLFGWTARYNLPGVTGGKSWRWRLTQTAAAIVANPQLAAELRWFATTASACGRA